MRIRCICLISLFHIVDSILSVNKDNKNKRRRLDELVSLLSKRQKTDEASGILQLSSLLGKKEQESGKYPKEYTIVENPSLVIDEATDNSGDVDEIASEGVHKKAITQSLEDLLKDRKSAIEKDNNPDNAYNLVESYMESVFGKAGEQVGNEKIDHTTSLLDWFSDTRNAQKLELKRYDLTFGFLRAFLSIFGLSEIRVLGRYKGLVTIRYSEGSNNDDKKTSESSNTNENSRKSLNYPRESIPHVNTVLITGYKFAALCSKKGLDETKIYAVLTVWLREIMVERFIYSWKIRHENGIYSCKIYHKLSKEQKEDIIVINVCGITHFNKNYKGKLPKSHFPFVISKVTNLKIIVECSIGLDSSFIDTLLGNTSSSKCEIIFMNALDIYKFHGDNKEHANVENFGCSVKLNNINLFFKKLRKCNYLNPIRYVFWDLDTKVSAIDISFLEYLKNVTETKGLKRLNRFTIVFPSQDSEVKTVAAFFEVFGNSNGRISDDSHKTLQNILKKHIELKTLKELDFLNKNLKQLFITLDTEISDGFRTPKKVLEVHFIYEDGTSREENVLDINNFVINGDEMALISKMKVDKLNLRNVIFRWSRVDKERLDAMKPNKASRWHGKIYSENSRYTMTEKERKECENERNRLLNNIRRKYYYKKSALKKKCVNSSFSDSWLNEEESKLVLERNNKILKTYEEYKTLWENISTEWINNGLEHFGKNKNHAAKNVDYENIFDSSDDVTISSFLS